MQQAERAAAHPGLHLGQDPGSGPCESHVMSCDTTYHLCDSVYQCYLSVSKAKRIFLTNLATESKIAKLT